MRAAATTAGQLAVAVVVVALVLASQDVEATVYFCVLEALQNVQKYAQASHPCHAPHAPASSDSWHWSGRRGSNPQLRPWEGRTLPLSYSRAGGRV